MIKEVRNPYTSFGRLYDTEHPIPIPKQVDLSSNEEVRLFLGLENTPIWGGPADQPAAKGTDWNKIFDTITKAATTVGTVLGATKGGSQQTQTGANPGGYSGPGASNPMQDPNMKLIMIGGAILLGLVLLIVLLKTLKG